jgi:hypothetical protein
MARGSIGAAQRQGLIAAQLRLRFESSVAARSPVMIAVGGTGWRFE